MSHITHGVLIQIDRKKRDWLDEGGLQERREGGKEKKGIVNASRWSNRLKGTIGHGIKLDKGKE